MGCQTDPTSAPSVQISDGASLSAPLTLVACPSSPNCVGSRETGRSAVPMFEISGDLDSAQEVLEKAVEEDGGTVQLSVRGYVWATYTSRIFRFTDDVEFLAVTDAASTRPGTTSFHVRSASRVGHSDLGVNRKRILRLGSDLNNQR